MSRNPGHPGNEAGSCNPTPAPSPPQLSPAAGHTSIGDLACLLDTLTDQQFARRVRTLPAGWTAPGPTGATITKEDLMTCIWGAYKANWTLQPFTQAILTAYPPPTAGPAIYNTDLTRFLAEGSTILVDHDRSMPVNGPHPHLLSTGQAVLMLHHSSHFTTLLLHHGTSYYYDSLGGSVPDVVADILTHIRTQYATLPHPTPPLPPAHATVQAPTPQQLDRPAEPWSCGMHMMCSSFSAIYQNGVPTLKYAQRHINKLHRAQLRYILTGTLDPWIGQLVELLKDPRPRRGTPRRPSASPPPHPPSNTWTATAGPQTPSTPQTTPRTRICWLPKGAETR